MMRALKTPVLAIAVVALLLSACQARVSRASTVNLPVVAVAQPWRGTAISSLTLPGDLVGYYEATLYAKVTGYLKTINVDKGDWVKAGQVLAVIEVPELRQSLQRAKANLAIQKLTYQRLEHVWASDPRLVARENVDIARSKFEEARAEADELQAMVSYTRIVAPFSGVITGRFVDPGALINAGSVSPSVPYAMGSAQGSAHPTGRASPVVSIAKVNLMRVYVYVPQEAVAKIHPGLPAIITVSSLGSKRFTGTVTRFATALSLSTRTMLTEIDLKNPHHELYPGMYARVTLELEHHPDALLLPDTAIMHQGANKYVFTVHKGRLVKVPVKTGIVTAHYVEIRSGLSDSADVVSNINPSLTASEAVRPVISEPLRWSGREVADAAH